MNKKSFVLNLAIQIDAEDEKHALEVLSSEETLKKILEAIAANQGNLEEITEESHEQLLNQSIELSCFYAIIEEEKTIFEGE